MLSELKIARFKTVREQALRFGRVNLFIGGNGTGKSNLLEAIGLASACLGRGLGDSDIGRKGLRISPPELMKSSFKNEDLPKTLSLDAEFSNDVAYRATLQSREGDPLLRFFSESASRGGRKVFGRSNRGASATGVSHADRLEQHRGLWDQIKATYEIDPLVALEFQQFSQYVIYTPQPDFLRGRQVGRIDTPPIGLHGEGLPEAVGSFLEKWRQYQPGGSLHTHEFERDLINSCVQLVWLPGWASMFGVHHAQPLLTSRDIVDRSSQIVYFADQYMHASRNRLSVYDSSEGTLFLLFAGIVLSHPDAPRVFALDNVDNALNPRLTKSLVEHIISVCRRSNEHDLPFGARQVFLTSHNPTALDAFDLFDDENRVFVVRRNEKGHTTAERLVPPAGMDRKKWEMVKAGRNLSQLWLDGDIPGALGRL